MNLQRLVWLASYPKSGNTWVRLFLAAYSHPERDELDINTIDVSLHAGNRDLFDRVIGLEASELTPTEIERYRPDVYRQLAVEADEPFFIKVHDRWRRNADGASIFPPETTAATVYIVRDPRGVAPSYANHYNSRFDRLQAQEEAAGFKERLIGASRFFRRGQADSWQEELTPAQIKRIETDHGVVIARLGYL